MVDWLNWVGLVGIPIALWALGRVEAQRAKQDAGVTERAAANEKAHDSLRLECSELHHRVTMLAQQLAEYRERVARDYATQEMLNQVDRRHADALRHIDEKLDRLLESR